MRRILAGEEGGGNDTTVYVGECSHDLPDDPTTLGTFGLFALVVGLFIVLITQRIKPLQVLPYTIYLLTIGILIGWVDFEIDLGPLGYSIKAWKFIDPHLVLYIFLPPLLFSSGIVVPWHVFKRLAMQSILLASVGVAINVFLIAIVAKVFFQYDWSWSESILFGSAFGSTDPVATVALLKELGAPETLSVLIEGESLLNDGTAFVIFLVLQENLSGTEQYDVGEIFLRILFVCVVGPLIGLAVGIVALKMMERVWNNGVIIVAISVAAAYASFFSGEYAKSSGVLAVVTVSVFLSGQHLSRVSRDVAEELRQYWEFIDYLGNTVLFIFAGMQVSAATISHETSEIVITGTEWGNVVLLYVLLNIIRAISVLLLYPALSRSGYGFNRAKFAITSFAGLRGAVGLISALFLVQGCTCRNPAPGVVCIEAEFAQLTMFFMAMIVLLTLLLNAPLTPPLMAYFQIAKQGEPAMLLFEKAVERIDDHTKVAVRALKLQPRYRGVDWAKVWASMPVLSETHMEKHFQERLHNPNVVEKYDEKLKNKLKKSQQKRFQANRASKQRNEQDFRNSLIVDARYRYLTLVRTSYLKFFAEGATRSWPHLQTLVEAVDRAQDNVSYPINEWEDSIASYCSIPSQMSKNPIIAFIASWYRYYVTYAKLLSAYHIASSFLEGHLHAIQEFYELSIDTQVADIIVSEAEVMISKAQIFLKEVEDSFEEISLTAKTSNAIQRLLKDTIDYIDELYDGGQIDKKDFQNFHKAIERALKSANIARHDIQQIRADDQIFKNSQIFDEVDSKHVSSLIKSANIRRLKAGETLSTQNEDMSYLYVIIRGKVGAFVKKTDVLKSNTNKAQQAPGILSKSSMQSMQKQHAQQPERHSLDMKKLVSDTEGVMNAENKATVIKVHGATAAAAERSSLRSRSNTESQKQLPLYSRLFSWCFRSKSSSLPIQRGFSSGSSVHNVVDGRVRGMEDYYLWTKLGRGDCIGELELVSEVLSVGTCVCLSSVLVYEIPFSAVRETMDKDKTGVLRENLIRQVGLLALMQHFPHLRTSAFSLWKYLLNNMDILDPTENTPFVLPAGSAIVLHGSVRVQNVSSSESFIPITIFKCPMSSVVCTRGTVILSISEDVIRLCETRSNDIPNDLPGGEVVRTAHANTKNLTDSINNNNTLQRNASVIDRPIRSAHSFIESSTRELSSSLDYTDGNAIAHKISMAKRNRVMSVTGVEASSNENNQTNEPKQQKSSSSAYTRRGSRIGGGKSLRPLSINTVSMSTIISQVPESPAIDSANIVDIQLDQKSLDLNTNTNMKDS